MITEHVINTMFSPQARGLVTGMVTVLLEVTDSIRSNCICVLVTWMSPTVGDSAQEILPENTCV